MIMNVVFKEKRIKNQKKRERVKKKCIIIVDIMKFLGEFMKINNLIVKGKD